MITLWDSLRKKFKGTFMKSSIKLNCCYDILNASMSDFCLTSGHVHDSKAFKFVDYAVKNMLYIFDLGYWDYNSLATLHNVGAYFLSRVKLSSNFLIVKVISGAKDNFIKNKNFKEVKSKLRKKNPL